MAGGTEFPSYLRLEHRPNPGASSSFLAELAGALDDGKRKFAEFSDEAKRQIDGALSVQRNALGSLDLGVDQLKGGAIAQQARATAAREVAAATAQAAREQGDYSQATRLSVAALEALAIEEERAAKAALSHAAAAEQVQAVLNRQKSATDAVVAASRRGTTESGNVINGVRAQRVAFTQLGQQMQDVVVQAQMGTNAMTIFVQQVPQAAFALSGLTESSNKFYRGVGNVASALSGPLGAGLIAVTALAGPFIYAMLKGSDAADDLKNKTLTVSAALQQLKSNTDEARKALEEYNAEQDRARDNADSMIKFNLRLADSAIKSAIATREQLKAELERRDADLRNPTLVFGEDEGNAYRAGQAYSIAQVEAKATANDAMLAILQQTSRGLNIQDAKREAEAATDAVKAINDKYDDMAAAAERAAAANSVLARSLKPVLIGIEAARKAELDAERQRKREDRTGIRTTEAFGSPLQGSYRQTGGFGESRPGHRHGGIDYAAPVGTPVFATQSGVVDFAAAAGAFGNLIKLMHGAGTETLYGHLSRFAVSDKQAVEKGQLIGYSGSTGRSTGPHLHYEVRVNGKAVDPTKGQFPIDPVKVAEAASKAADQLQDFGDRASESIARISERFDEQPRLIDQVAQSTRQLDAIIKDLGDRKPPGFQQMVEEATRAKAVVQDAIPRIFRNDARDSQRAIDIQNIVSQGREAEATALGRIFEKEERLGPLTADRKREIIATAEAEQRHTEELQRALEIQSAYLDATRSARQEIEAILSGTGKLSNFKQIFKNLQGKVLAETLFGDIFRDLDKWVKEKTGIGSSVDALQQEVERSSNVVSLFADAVAGATSRINGNVAAGGSTATGGAFGTIAAGAGLVGSLGGFGSLLAGGGANDNFDPNGEIVVVANKTRGGRTVNDLTPQEYFDRLTKDLGKGITGGLNRVFDTTFFSRFSGVLGGALGGYATGGATGGILGALKGIKGLPDGIASALGKAGKGAGTGTAVSGIAGAFGVNLSNTGAQIGGAIGSFLPIPGGDIIGAIAGGIIGKLIGGTKRGSATIGGTGGNLDITGTSGNSSSFIKAASGAGDSIISAVERIADTFGATVNAALGSVSIGIRDGKYRVDTTGQGITKTSKGAVDFGKDGSAAAIQFAVLNLIQDGVVQGLRQGTQTLLKNAKDLDSGLAKAVDFEGIFARLKEIEDPVGAAVEAIDKKFARLRQIATEAGEGLVEVEKLYGLERAAAVKQALQQITGSLQSLYDELTIGDNGLSIRARRDEALARYTPLAARVQSGDITAYDDFARAAQALLPLQRQIEGSGTAYFALFDSIKDLTKATLDAENARIAASDNPTANSAVPVADNSSVVSAIETQTTTLATAITTGLGAVNDNLGTLIEQALANGTFATIPDFAGNY